MKDLRPLLAEYRVMLMGPAMESYVQTGRSYPDKTEVSIQPGMTLEPYSTYWGGTGSSLVSMGSFSYTGSILSGLFRVGRYSSIAAGLKVLGNPHPHNWVSNSPTFYRNQLMAKTYAADRGVGLDFRSYEPKPGPITIGHDVWIGANVTLVPGITIGNGAVVASNAVVTKDVEPYTLVGGVAAKKLRDRFPADVSDRLDALGWWNYGPEAMAGLSLDEPANFCNEFAGRLAEGSIQPFSPVPLTSDHIAERLLPSDLGSLVPVG